MLFEQPFGLPYLQSRLNGWMNCDSTSFSTASVKLGLNGDDEIQGCVCNESPLTVGKISDSSGAGTQDQPALNLQSYRRSISGCNLFT